jgi:hypothetical protein
MLRIIVILFTPINLSENNLGKNLSSFLNLTLNIHVSAEIFLQFLSYNAFAR